MTFWEGTLGVAVGLFVVLALAEWAKYRQRRDRAFRLLASSAFFFAVSAIFELPDVFNLGWNFGLQNAFLFLGELSAFAAAVFLFLDSMNDWKKDLKI